MRVFTATSRYMQGPGLLDRLGPLTLELGQRAVVVCDAEVRRMFGDRLQRCFDEAKAPVRILDFVGDITHASIDELSYAAAEFGADVVVGVGGGKSIDSGKAVARKLEARFVSVPTIASNDGPASNAIAVYDDSHHLVDILFMRRNPDLVLVDSQVIISAPLVFLRAGLGDALSKKFESDACVAAGGLTLQQVPPSPTGRMLAEGCYSLLRAHAAAGLRDAALGKVTEDVERLIEGAVLLSTLAFENAGLSMAHAMARGVPFTARGARSLHGLHVAYGLLVQFVLERRTRAFLDDMLAFYAETGLPKSLRDLGVPDPTEEEFEAILEGVMGSPSLKRFPITVEPDTIRMAMQTIEGLAQH